MKVLTELLPIGAGIALVAAVTWFLLDRNVGLGKWLLAALLFAHGWVHVMFLFPTPVAAPAAAGGLTYPFDMGRSWLITGMGLDAGAVRIVGIVLIVATLVGFLLAALATLGWLVPASYWGGLVLASAAGSTVLLVLFFSPALLLGFGINVALWILVLASVWSPSGGPVGA
jgi:hypothetical protein